MSKGSSLSIWCIVALLLLAGIANVAQAQVLYGSLTGNVSDPTSAAIPGAKVTALNIETGISRQTETDARGAFLFTNMQLGLYKVTVEARGFATTFMDKVQVSSNEVRRADFGLKLAQTSETVEVSGAATALQTDKSDVRSEISSQEVAQLPYTGGEGKNFQSLLYLVPGAGVPGTREANSEAGNPQRAQTLFMNGVSSTGNSTKLDGTIIAYPWLPVNIAYVPPSEAIQTVNISTNSFDAEQGAAGGAAINVTIKSGTNDLHGVAFERHNDHNMNAINYFNQGKPVNKNIFNEYGFAVGGPVYIPKLFNGRNKLFFFADMQRTTRRQYASNINMTLPTAAMRTGDFSATGATIYDPLTGNADGTGRTQFDGNKIPSSRFDPASVTLTSLLPGLTRPDALLQNYDAYGNTTYGRYNWDFKVNYNPSDKLMVWGRYSISPMDIVSLLVLGKAGGDAFGGGNPGHAGGRVQTTAAGFTYTLSSNFLIDGNIGFTRQNIGANGDTDLGPYGLEVLKIPGTNGDSVNYYGVPGFQVANMSNVGNTNTGSPFQFRDNQYVTGINVSKIVGAHQLRFGFQMDKYGLNHFQPQGGTFGTARGTFGFSGNLTVLNGQTPNPQNVPSNSYAQFLLGFPNRLGKITQLNNPNALRFSDWAFYARDQWQITRNLTINYGMRWEYYPIFSHDNYGATRFDVPTLTQLIGGMGGVPSDTGATATKKGFAPRFGIAYRLGSKTVVRSGYGITIDPDNMRNQRNAYPVVLNQDYNASGYAFATVGTVTQASLRTGLPAPTRPDISSGKITASNASTCTASTYCQSTGIGATFPQHMNRGYIQSWNFFVQREVTPSLTAEAGYVGTHAVHQTMNVNINASAPGTTSSSYRQLAPALLSDLNMIAPFGSMTYNGLQTKIQKRFTGSLVGLSYTYSKTINNYQGDNGDGFLWRAYPVSFKLNKAIAGFDRPHTFQLYHVIDLPIGTGKKYLGHGALGYIVGNWQISGTLSRFSGLPFTVGSSTNSLSFGQNQSAEQVKADVQILGGHDAFHPYFDGTAFGNPNTGRLGSTGRNLLRGPGFFNMDESVTRTFSFKEGRVKFQLVGEFFNLLNHTNFNNPGATFATPTYNTDGSVKSYGNYSVITGAAAARSIQVGGYIRF